MLVLTDNTHYSNIADAIREKTGTSQTYTPSQMGSAIRDISGGGGGISIDDLATTGLTGSIYIMASDIKNYAFYSQMISAVDAPNATTIGANAFNNCYSLITANFPNVTTIGGSAFYNCTKLTTTNFSNVTTISSCAFYQCSSLTTANFPNTTTINNSAFQYCPSLTIASFPNVTSIGSYAFQYCTKLIELRLDSVTSVPKLFASAFKSTPIGGYSTKAGQYGSVFVPASLYQSFLTASYWSSIAARIVSV